MNHKLDLTTASVLPPFLNEVLIGFILGDGGIFYASKRSATPRFEFSMGQERWAFAQHMALLYELYANNPLKEVKVQAVVNGKWLISYRFKTQSLVVFTHYRCLFYKVNRITGKTVKVVPHNIVDLLTPVVLAYLIMSDGNYDAKRNRVRIYTNSFTKADVELLAGAIQSKYDINAGVMADKKDQYIITIGAKELPKLRSLVSQHMLPSMKYRIGE